jgi:membrane complex biogenesis BtpA family protein
MLHAPPLPGAPRYGGDWRTVCDTVLRDAEALAAGGVHGLLLENFGDAPFFPGSNPPHVAAHLAALAAPITNRFELPLGINVLRNDGLAALAVAAAAGGAFIRVNVLCGARVTDQGLISGIAHDLLRERARLRAEHIQILADVDVKHSAPLAPRPLEEEVQETTERGGADGVIISGAATGQPTDIAALAAAKRAAGETPVFVGSGVAVETLDNLIPHADGFIVGTALKYDGRVGNPVDPVRVGELVQRLG